MKMLPYSNFTAEEIDGYIRSVKPEQVKRSLSQAEHKFTDFLHFISPAAADLLPEMTEVSARIKRRHFGNTVRTFAPLYISSYCMNNCVYCGFRKSYDYPRRRIRLDQARNPPRSELPAARSRRNLQGGGRTGRDGLYRTALHQRRPGAREAA